MTIKRTLTIAGICAAALTVGAGIVEDTKSHPELAGTVTFAPFRDITAKASSFGKVIGNPTMATLMLSAGQQGVVEKFGRFRSDAPFMFMTYIQTPAWDIAATNSDEVAIEDLCEPVFVFPSAEGPAALALKYPSATKSEDGVLHVPKSENFPFDAYVKYTADGHFCAYAKSPELAALGLADFTKITAAAKASSYPLLQFKLFERGLAAIAQFEGEAMAFVEQMQADARASTESGTEGLVESVNSSQRAQIREFFQELKKTKSYEIVLDYDAVGLKVEGVLQRKPGAPQVAWAPLPGGVLNHTPDMPLMSVFYNMMYVSGSEEKFRREMNDVAALVDQLVAIINSQLAKEEDGKKFVGFVTDLGKVVGQALRTAIYPSSEDWCGSSIAFTREYHPYCRSVFHLRQVDAMKGYADRICDSVVAAVDKQWPGQKIFTRAPGGVVFDWHATLDLIGRESGVQPGDSDDKELTVIKEKVSQVLGSGKTICTTSWGSDICQSYLGCPEDAAAAATVPQTGESRMAAALPEVKGKRPVLTVFSEPYAFVRDSVFPLVAKVADPSVAKECQNYRKILPPAEPNSAWAFALWSDASGSRGIFRVTAGELKNYGAAFNAIMLSSLNDGDADGNE